MKTGDKIVIGTLLMISAVLFVLSLTIGGTAGAEAVITVDGREETRLPLDEDAVYTVQRGESLNIIRIENGAAYMEYADCPDGHCIAQGAVSRTGEVIVCLPNRVTVTITGAQEELDAVAY